MYENLKKARVTKPATMKYAPVAMAAILNQKHSGHHQYMGKTLIGEGARASPPGQVGWEKHNLL